MLPNGASDRMRTAMDRMRAVTLLALRMMRISSGAWCKKNMMLADDDLLDCIVRSLAGCIVYSRLESNFGAASVET